MIKNSVLKILPFFLQQYMSENQGVSQQLILCIKTHKRATILQYDDASLTENNAVFNNSFTK